MGDTKISDLPAVTIPAGTDEFAVNQLGVDKKIDASQVIITGGRDLGSVIVATERFVLQFEQLTIASTDTVTLEGTAQILLTDYDTKDTFIIGVPKGGSFTVPDNYFADMPGQIRLGSSDVATLLGTAEMLLTDDFGTRSSINLVGSA